MSRILDVYLHEIFTGKLIQEDSGTLSFSYDEKYLGKHLPSLSVSLPQTKIEYHGTVVKAFFSGFLPDDIARHRLAKYLGVSDKNPFAMLEAIGGECAGAISIYPEGSIPPLPSEHDIEILDDQALKSILELLKRRPLLVGSDDIRLSLAGVQDKIAVGIKDGKIALIKGNSPTSHILKPMIQDIFESVHNEFFCMRLAGLMGIHTPATEIRFLGDNPYFLVARYDRIVDGGGRLKRLHQEDFCQALSIPPELKYEREGGPTMAKCFDLIENYSLQPAVDQLAFLKHIIFNYLIANSDAHGKNFSFLYKNKGPTLAPAYDLFCTAVYPELSLKMAMKIGGKYDPEDVFLRHWHKLVHESAAAKNNLEKQLKYMAVDCVDKAYALKISLEQDGIPGTIYDDICKVILSRAHRIKKYFI